MKPLYTPLWADENACELEPVAEQQSWFSGGRMLLVLILASWCVVALATYITCKLLG